MAGNTDFPMDYTPSLPLLSPGEISPEFSYGAFLQEQDIDYLAEESSTSTNTISEATTHTLTPPATSQALTHRESSASASASSPTTGQSNAAAQQRQRLERRGHTKSRRGCFNCKRRRIKCQETKPACGHCAKTGLRCEYPTMPVVVHQPRHQIPIFTLQDMRFFQHFLVQCYPHHPIGSENLWLHEVPCLSEKYEYLMHAILGYAASELIAEDPSLAEPAMMHRLKAIKAIKKTLADVPKADTFEEGNALMATCFALTYQSVLLEDGMAEFMTFIRGIVIVAVQMYVKGAKLLFGDYLGDPVQEKLEPYMKEVPLVEKSWADRAVRGLKRLRPLCEGRPVEAKYVDMITETAEQLYVSSWGAYQAMGKHYGWWMMIPHDEFEKIIDTGSQIATVMAAHWMALTQIMAIITETEIKAAVKKPSNQGSPGPGMVAWLKHLNQKVDAEHLPYNEFPRWVEARLDESLLYFGRRGGWAGNTFSG